MWYALAPELQIPVVPVISVPVVLHRSPPVRPKPSVSFFSDPPATFFFDVRLPASYRVSERGALRYIARKLHIQFRFTGPNYAMIGEKIPYGEAVPAIILLKRIAGISYIQGSFALLGGQVLVVHNAPLVGD